jgi:hypothetical protein
MQSVHSHLEKQTRYAQKMHWINPLLLPGQYALSHSAVTRLWAGSNLIENASSVKSSVTRQTPANIVQLVLAIPVASAAVQLLRH